MNRIFLGLCFLSPLFAFAQLQSPNAEPGESFVQKVVSSFYPLEDGGTTNQTYDLTYLNNPEWGPVAAGSTLLSVASTPNGKVYGGADIAMEGGGQTVYYSYGDSYEYHGGVQNNLVVAYDDTEVYFPYPYSIGDSWEDGFSCEYGAAGITIYRTGNVVSECISSGTLGLPGPVNYENVYRIHMTEMLVDSTFLGTYELVVEGDYFMSAAYPLTLAALINITTTDTPITGNPIITESTAGVWLDQYVVQTPELERPSWAMLPNPATDHIALVGLTSANSEVVVYGMDGREWLREVVRPGLTAQVINVRELPVGTYVVRTADGAAQQLVIQR